MTISLVGLAIALFLLIGAVATRVVIGKALAYADRDDVKTLPPERLEEKRKVRRVVITVLNVDILLLPVVGYFIGAVALENL